MFLSFFSFELIVVICRFDFSHGKSLDSEQVAELDRIVRGLISKELPVYSKIVPLSEAKKIKGHRAVFGEVYPDPVRYQPTTHKTHIVRT